MVLLVVMLIIFNCHKRTALKPYVTVLCQALHVPSDSLYGHIKTRINWGFEQWPGVTPALAHIASEAITNQLVLETNTNKELLASGQFVSKALRAYTKYDSRLYRYLAGNSANTSTGTSDIGSVSATDIDMKIALNEILNDYKVNMEKNKAIYVQITSHHKKLADVVTAKKEESQQKKAWDEVVVDQQIDYQSYADAATLMGNKKWVQDGIKWMENFAISYFRRGMARKEYLRMMDGTMHADDFQKLCQSIKKDLMASEVDCNGYNRIKILDVGSCYNPIINSPNADAFDVTAIDLCPKNTSVYQCDFLNLRVSNTDTVSVITDSGDPSGIKALTSLPAASFDAVVFSLVLSYLPAPSQRLAMIKKAHMLLKRNMDKVAKPHYSPLLLIVEKESIYRSPSIDSSRGNGRTNNTLLSEWKDVITDCGFTLIKYNNLNTIDGRRCHTFAFKVNESANSTATNTVVDTASDSSKAIKQMWIKQDFVTDKIAASPGGWDAHGKLKTPNSVNQLFNSNGVLQYPIGIVGCGLGGSALALALQRKGIPVKVFEKDSSLTARKQGYALTVQQASKTLRALGLGYDMLKEGITSRKHISFTSTGDELGAYGAVTRNEKSQEQIDIDDVKVTRDKAKYNVHMPRQKVRELLMKGIDPSSILWNMRLTSYVDSTSIDDNIVQLHFDDGSVHMVSMLVASDGIYSTATKQLLADDMRQLNYLNLMVILGISPCIINSDNYQQVLYGDSPDAELLRYKCRGSESIRQQMQWVDGNGVRVFTMPYSTTQTMWQMSFPIQEHIAIELQHGSMSQLKDKALQVCHGWHPSMVALIQSTDVGMISGHPAYDRDPLQYPLASRRHNPYSRVTVLGDAAHPMSPFKGQGFNQALLDVTELTKQITSSELSRPGKRSILHAIDEYEHEMLLRSGVKIDKSRTAAALLHSPLAMTAGDITRVSAAEGLAQ